MKYEHQINWANAYDTNLDLDISSSGLSRNGSIYLLSTVQSLLSEQRKNLTCCTLYDRKNKNFIQFLTNYTSSFLVAFCLFQAYFCCCCFYNQYASLVSSFLLPSSCLCFYYFAHRTNTLNFSECLGNTMNFSECLV